MTQQTAEESVQEEQETETTTETTDNTEADVQEEETEPQTNPEAPVITLTDEEDIPDAVRKLQVIYPNLMKLDYDNQRTRGRKSFADVQEVEEKTPFDIFEDLYEKQNNQEMNEEQKQLIHSLIEKIWEDKN